MTAARIQNVKNSTKTIPGGLAIAGIPCLIPPAVFLLAGRHSEGPFGNAFEMLAVMAMGAALAVGYAFVAALNIRTARGGAAAWILGAGIALSPALYFVVWNVFFRRN